MADGLLGKNKARMNFPESGQEEYLAATLKLGMWRRVSPRGYSAARVAGLLDTAKAKGKAFYSRGLYSLETLAKANR